MFGGIYFAGAAFAGLVGGLGGTTPPGGAIDTTVGITIDGVPVTARVRVQGVTIHDVLNDAPNTATLVIEGDGPAVGQSLKITLNAGALVLFAGQVQTVDQAFESKPEHVAWAVTAIDDTARANYRRPFGTWVNTSATTIAQAISVAYAPTFSTAGIAGALPAVSIVFDGSDTFIAALVRLASAIGGYAKIEDGVVYLFQTDTTAPPDPIDADHRFLHTPAIQANVDSSQLRTRVYGKGYGENVLADLAVGETLVPIPDGAQFPPFGSQAILAVTADGAQSEKIAFTGVDLAGGGTLVGTGAGPTVAPDLAIAPGAGVTNGHHDVAVVFVTALGKSLPGPIAGVDVPTFPPPATAPVPSSPLNGTGPDQGAHDYGVSFVTAFGETVLGPITNAVATSAAVGQIAPPGNLLAQMPANPGAGLEDGLYRYVVTLVNAAGETTPGPEAGFYNILAPNSQVQLYGIPTGPAGTTGRRIYREYNGSAVFNLLTSIGDNTTTSYLDTKSNSGLGAAAPTSNTTGTAVQRIPLAAIPLGPPGTTARKIYRRFNWAGTFKLVTTLANNTTTTFTDTVPNSGLGANALTTATAVGNQIAATIPKGPSAVTARELYMSPAGSSVRKLALVVPDNTTTTATITIADASLAVAAGEPIADTSGLQQPQGQVNPGAAVLPVAAAATFRPGGGWVVLGGGQVVRYTAIAGQTLTGIPAAGSGAITTTVLFGQQAIPSALLVGVTGIAVPIQKGAAVNLWVQVDDLQAQAEQRARAGGDGVIEYLLTDTRRAIESLTARCVADLAQFSRPIVTVAYATRDVKSKSGKEVVIDLASPAIHETLTIQEVTITEIDIAKGLAPRFMVRASTVRFSLEDTLRRLIAGGSIVGGSS